MLHGQLRFRQIVLLPGLLLIGFHATGARSSDSEETPWGPSVGDLQVRLLPQKEVYRPADPLALRLQVRNGGTTEARLRIGQQVKETSATRPQLLSLTMTSASGTTAALYSRTFEPGSADSHGMGISFNTPATVLIPPGGAFRETTVYLESGLLAARTPVLPLLKDEGTATFTVRLLTTDLEVGGRPLPDTLPGREQVILSNPCPVTLSGSDLATSSTWHDSLSWWESMTLSLFDDGRFLFNCFSDAGGDRPPVKGTWKEVSGNIVLEGVVNRDVLEFDRHRVWKKMQVGRWPVLMPPEVAAGYEPGTYPNVYPVLSQGPSENPGTRMVVRPWDAETSRPARRVKAPLPQE